MFINTTGIVFHMYESKVMALKGIPVFSLSDVSQIVSGKDYAKKFLRRLVSSGEIKRIKKDAYTFHEDPFLVSTFLVRPSYISSVSALAYHRIITQIPRDVFCFTQGKQRKFKFISEINFIHTNHFFGFENQKYEGFGLPIASPEKAIIDSINTAPFSVFDEAIEKVDLERMLEYLRRIGKSSVTKRVGYLLEENGFDVYEKLKSGLNGRYVCLDPLARKTGARDKKWRLIVNTK